MKWDVPPKIKIYEALGSLGDDRLEFSENKGKLYSSSGNKYYDIIYNPDTNSIMCNDNASFYVGYLGYPAISFLMKKGLIQYDHKWEDALKDIKWKDINQKFKNNFSKTEEYSLGILEKRGFDKEEFLTQVDYIYSQIQKLEINILGEKIKPPSGY